MYYHFDLPNGKEFSDEKIEKRIRKAGDERLFYIAEALKRGVTPKPFMNGARLIYSSYIKCKKLSS